MTYKKYDDAGVMTDTAALSLLQQAATAIDSASVSAAPAENRLVEVIEDAALPGVGHAELSRVLLDVRSARSLLDRAGRSTESIVRLIKSGVESTGE